MTSGDSNTIQNHAAFIWSVADLLRGDYKQSEYGKVILPLTVLRRLDCAFKPTKQVEAVSMGITFIQLDSGFC